MRKIDNELAKMIIEAAEDARIYYAGLKMNPNPFKIGDRVTRPIDVYNPKSPIRHGTIIEKYSQPWENRISGFVDDTGVYHEPVIISKGIDPELYKVQWDDGKVQRGFFRHGLDKE